MGFKHVWLVCWQAVNRSGLTWSFPPFANVPALGKNCITITLLKLLLISAALTSSGVYDLIGEDGYENLPDEHHAEYISANGVYTIRATPRCPVPENSTDNHYIDAQFSIRIFHQFLLCKSWVKF